MKKSPFKMIPAFHGKIIKGRLKLLKPDKFKLWVGTMDNKEVVLSVEEKKEFSKRTLNQNALYWAYLRLISEDTGNQVEELHSYFKQRFLSKREVCVKGVCDEVIGSTKTLDKLEFGKYLDKIEDLTEVLIPNTKDIWK